MTLIGNANGKLHVQQQVEDYALQGIEFEEMGFLTFTVETYERRIGSENKDEVENSEETGHSTRNQYSQYLTGHPKNSTHMRVCQSVYHNSLPNIVGCWLPRRDGEDDTKPYYYASMLAFLKPWHDLQCLKNDCESWKSAFDGYMRTVTQWDRDVVAGCQYYYDSRMAVGNRDDTEEGMDVDVDMHHEDNDVIEDENEIIDENLPTSVSDT